MTASPADRERVAVLLGRIPRGDFDVVVRTVSGDPAVLRNAPLLDDGTPMPTRHWLVHSGLRAAIGTLESHGGVRRAEAELDAEAIARAHAAHAAERDGDLPTGYEGPKPFGGVGGTRRGVKCLHAHYAHWLAGGADPVGAWVHEQLLDTDLMPADAPGRITS
ncbi:DUF501 domain-containing protein [Rhabdothermincola salaria]|uniref:DUF501 domain-containing protein n=1 Tax=Rhabdothermincola salaria TaxID=2903142 RepID=UPI001E3CD7A5|nr:DUF501 domain-containing protein [Rhabdothermincola salaria]